MRKSYLVNFFLAAFFFAVTSLFFGYADARSNSDLKSLSLAVPSVLKKMGEEPRFWKKPGLDVRVKKGEVLTSVQEEVGEWSFRGAGLVKVPPEFCFKEAKNFSRLKALSDHFPLVEMDESKSQLHLKMKFLGQERELWVNLFEETVPAKGKVESERRIYFQVADGWLKDLGGVLVIENGADSARQASIVGVLGRSKSPAGWVPGWIFKVAVEAVMHHVSVSLRTTLEKDYKH